MPTDYEPQTLGEEIIAWIETACRVLEGVLIGQPIELMLWQKREILRIYDNPAVTRRAIISVGRKSGKTSLAACLLLAQSLTISYVKKHRRISLRSYKR
jgi:phage terminase large subunit-like protein